MYFLCVCVWQTGNYFCFKATEVIRNQRNSILIDKTAQKCDWDTLQLWPSLQHIKTLLWLIFFFLFAQLLLHTFQPWHWTTKENKHCPSSFIHTWSEVARFVWMRASHNMPTWTTALTKVDEKAATEKLLLPSSCTIFHCNKWKESTSTILAKYTT